VDGVFSAVLIALNFSPAIASNPIDQAWQANICSLPRGCRRTAAAIARLSKKRGYCYARPATLGRFLGVTDRTIRRHVAALISAGLVVRSAAGLAPFLAAECPQNVREMSGAYKECQTEDVRISTPTTTTPSSKHARATPAEPATAAAVLLVEKLEMPINRANELADVPERVVAAAIAIATAPTTRVARPAAWVYAALRDRYDLSPPPAIAAPLAAADAGRERDRDAPTAHRPGCLCERCRAARAESPAAIAERERRRALLIAEDEAKRRAERAARAAPISPAAAAAAAAVRAALFGRAAPPPDAAKVTAKKGVGASIPPTFSRLSQEC
jgi:Helix-turn-helix domain